MANKLNSSLIVLGAEVREPLHLNCTLFSHVCSLLGLKLFFSFTSQVVYVLRILLTAFVNLVSVMLMLYVLCYEGIHSQEA